VITIEKKRKREKERMGEKERTKERECLTFPMYYKNTIKILYYKIEVIKYHYN